MDKEESKELLEKKEGDNDNNDEEEKKEGEAAEEGETKKESSPCKGSSLLDSIRNVASHVPSLFKSKDKVRICFQLLTIMV